MPSQKSKIKKNKVRLTGVAAQDSSSKTVPVILSVTRAHPLYLKRFIHKTKILAHTENEIKKGQILVIEQSRPISHLKSWKVIEVK